MAQKRYCPSLITWRAPLRRGISLGAFHVDTAESYETEDAVGEAISDIRDQVFLTTKVHPSHFRYDQVMEAAEGSLRRLRTDRIDLYLLQLGEPRGAHRGDDGGYGQAGR